MKTNDYVVYGAVALVALILLSSGGFLGATPPQAQLLIPHYGSIVCQQGGTKDVTVNVDQTFWLMPSYDKGQIGSLLYSSALTCNPFDGTSQNVAKILRVVQRTEGSNEAYQIVAEKSKAYIDTTGYSSADFSGITLSPGREYKFEAVCKYQTPIIGTIHENTPNNIALYKLQVQYTYKSWMKYIDGAPAPLTGSGGDGCAYTSLKSAPIYSGTPTSTTGFGIIDYAKGFADDFGIDLTKFGSDGGKAPVISSPTSGNAKINDGWRFVDRWQSAPTYNIKTYNSQPVYCASAIGEPSLYSVKIVETMGGSSYYLPTAKLTASIDCCNTGDCGLNTQCDLTTFKCVQNAQCSVDSDCIGQCQQIFTPTTGGYVWQTGDGKCSTGKCVCTKVTTECKPGSCSSGWSCDLAQRKCVPSEACPSMKKCVVQSGCKYQAQDCPSGYVPCPSGNSCYENCEKSCQTQACATNADCDDANAKTKDICVRPLIGMAYCTNTVITTGCTSDSQCDDNNLKTTDKCVKDLLGNGACENKLTAEVGCFEKCGVLNVGCTADCYVKELTLGINAAIASGVKFIVSLVALVGGTLLSNHLLKGMFPKRRRWKANLLALIIGFVCFAMVILT